MLKQFLLLHQLHDKPYFSVSVLISLLPWYIICLCVLRSRCASEQDFRIRFGAYYIISVCLSKKIASMFHVIGVFSWNVCYGWIASTISAVTRTYKKGTFLIPCISIPIKDSVVITGNLGGGIVHLLYPPSLTTLS